MVMTLEERKAAAAKAVATRRARLAAGETQSLRSLKAGRSSSPRPAPVAGDVAALAGAILFHDFSGATIDPETVAIARRLMQQGMPSGGSAPPSHRTHTTRALQAIAAERKAGPRPKALATWTQVQDVHVAETPVGKFVIRRLQKGSPEFRLHLNGKPGKYTGPVDFLQRTVDQILAVHDKPAPGLNAVGKPYGATFDPNYRMRYRTPRPKQVFERVNGISPERWEQMCKEAAAAWKKHKGPTPMKYGVANP